MTRFEDVTIVGTTMSYDQATAAFDWLCQTPLRPTIVNLAKFYKKPQRRLESLRSFLAPSILLVDHPHRPKASRLNSQTIGAASTILQIREDHPDAFSTVILPRHPESYTVWPGIERKTITDLGAVSVQDIYGVTPEMLFGLSESEINSSHNLNRVKPITT